MFLQPLEQAIASQNWQKKIRLIATDVDGTLTQQGKFTPNLIQSLEKLAQAGIQVILVTGRSAGWVQAIKTYLPVEGAIAENGGLFYSRDHDIPLFLTPISDLTLHRQHLSEIFQFLKTQYPKITESNDNCFRLTDWTFDVQGLSLSDLKILTNLCLKQAWGFTYSTVQCHIKPQKQDKSTGLLQVISQYFPQLSTDEIITVGDSPNDETLFNSQHFPHSVGVANILHYRAQLAHQPTYVTTKEEVAGFCQLTQLLV